MASPISTEGPFKDIKIADIIVPANKRKYTRLAVGYQDYHDAMDCIEMYQKQVTRMTPDDQRRIIQIIREGRFLHTKSSRESLTSHVLYKEIEDREFNSEFLLWSSYLILLALYGKNLPSVYTDKIKKKFKTVQVKDYSAEFIAQLPMTSQEDVSSTSIEDGAEGSKSDGDSAFPKPKRQKTSLQESSLIKQPASDTASDHKIHKAFRTKRTAREVAEQFGYTTPLNVGIPQISIPITSSPFANLHLSRRHSMGSDSRNLPRNDFMPQEVRTPRKVGQAVISLGSSESIRPKEPHQPTTVQPPTSSKATTPAVTSSPGIDVNGILGILIERYSQIPTSSKATTPAATSSSGIDVNGNLGNLGERHSQPPTSSKATTPAVTSSPGIDVNGILGILIERYSQPPTLFKAATLLVTSPTGTDVDGILGSLGTTYGQPPSSHSVATAVITPTTGVDVRRSQLSHQTHTESNAKKEKAKTMTQAGRASIKKHLEKLERGIRVLYEKVKITNTTLTEVQAALTELKDKLQATDNDAVMTKTILHNIDSKLTTAMEVAAMDRKEYHATVSNINEVIMGMVQSTKNTEDE